MSFTFKKGLSIDDRKQLTKDLSISTMKEPQEVFVPLMSYASFAAEPVVKVGDSVIKGQILAKSVSNMTAEIFSSVCGTVKDIIKLETACGAKVDHIHIENNFAEQEELLEPLKDLSRQAIITRVKDAGIVGMGGAGFPTHTKLNAPQETDLLIINAAECEPYLTCDDAVMKEYTEEFLSGVNLLKIASGAKYAVIGIESNKIDAIQKLIEFGCQTVKDFRNLSQEKINLCVLKSRYPQGAEKQLIYAVSKRVQKEGKLPYTCGVCVDNVQTAYAAYNAVFLGKKLYERVVTVSGTAVKLCGNYIIKAGTLYKHIAEVCGENNPDLVVSGGPMMGSTVFTEKLASTNANGGILFLKNSEAKYNPPSPCIACSKCVQVCPMFLMPVFIDSNVLTGNYKESKKFGALACIECGCCSYICPAKKPLVQGIKLAKKIIRERGL